MDNRYVFRNFAATLLSMSKSRSNRESGRKEQSISSNGTIEQCEIVRNRGRNAVPVTTAGDCTTQVAIL